MNPAAKPPDSLPSRWLFAVLFAAVGILIVAAAITLSGGCSKPPTTAGGDPATNTPKGDAWKAAGTRLSKETDLPATKSALASITSDIGNQAGEKLPAISEEALTALAGVVPLSPADRDELRGASFSAHDPVYLADCFYLRDAARSLGLAGLPPEKQADLAFAWVCRQVYLQPWLRQVGPQAFEPTAIPPTAVLRRGFGSGLERMYVFLALLQQLELEGCLIGGADAENMESRAGVTINYAHVSQYKVPRGPFWAVGVRVGNDARLFDPWRGQALPVTLNQLKANPDATKAWFEDKANISGATLDDAKKAAVFLAVPVNALSPRMGAFETKLKGELGAKVAYDQKSLEAMRAALPGTKFWNPSNDPFTYGRVARSYLPVELGGSDRTPQSGGRLYESSLREQVPTSVFRLPDELTAIAAQQRLGGVAGTMLAISFIEPPNPRERIQRGRFQDASKDLVTKQEAFAAGLERLRTQDAGAQKEQIREWLQATNKLYEELTRAQLNKNKEEEAQMLALLDQNWKQPPAQWLIDKASAEVGRAEAAFLLALCKHEQAEQAQVRLERANPADLNRLKLEASDAWKTALSSWRTYEQLSSAHAGFPGRAAHAQSLTERAAKLAEGDGKK